MGLAPIRLGGVPVKSTIFGIEGLAAAHLSQGESNVVQVRRFAAGLVKVQEEIIGFGMQEFELGAVATVDRIGQPFHHAGYFGYDGWAQGSPIVVRGAIVIGTCLSLCGLDDGFALLMQRYHFDQEVDKRLGFHEVDAE